MKCYKNLKAKVQYEVEDLQILPLCGGIEIIHTPGHTLGHIALYLIKEKTLIAGDMLTIENNELKAANYIFVDEDLSKKSLEKLKKYDIRKVICYHGGMIDTSNKIIESILSKS